ncbi:hypothetical protein N431DRAFT_469962 [Stipitochalara longipes BDJ]|nr:hypothetical protein N431DRAFT_469962 [Stipitochalara longipes BDJ]
MDPLAYMRSSLVIAGIAPRFWPSFEFTKLFSQCPRTRGRTGRRVRNPERVTDRKSWPQDALALQIGNFLEVDAVRFVETFIESRVPMQSTNPFAIDARPQKTISGEFTITGYEGDVFEGIAAIIGSFDMPHILFARAYAKKLAFMLAKNLTELVSVDTALEFCEFFCYSVHHILEQCKPEDYNYGRAWSDQLLMALGRYRLTPKEKVEVELFSTSMCRVALWKHLYVDHREESYTQSADIKARASRLGTAVGNRLQYFGYDIATFFNATLYETLRERISRRKVKTQKEGDNAKTEDEAKAEDAYDMMDLDE